MTEMINRDNYEAYFLDFVEGRLSTEQEEMLSRFLKFNPDLEQELKGFDMITLKGGTVTFDQKASLKKEMPGDDGVTPSNFEMYCIAYLEGDLTRDQRDLFLKYMDNNPGKQEELELFRNTRLVPEPITYSQKEVLKRTSKRGASVRYLIPVLAAASIALLVFFGPMANRDSVPIVAEELYERAMVDPGPSSIDPDGTVTDPEGNVTDPEGTSSDPDRASDNMVNGSKTRNNQAISSSNSSEIVNKAKGDENQTKRERSGVILESAGIGNPSSIQMIKQSGGREVPVSNLEVNSRGSASGSEKNSIRSLAEGIRFASADLKAPTEVSYKAKRDELVSKPVGPISVDPGSFTAQELARYRINQINQVVEDDAIIWNLASRGIEELNKRVGTEGKLIASVEEDGSVSGIRFRSRYLNVTAPLPGQDE